MLGVVDVYCGYGCGAGYTMERVISSVPCPPCGADGERATYSNPQQRSIYTLCLCNP
jgi:hypothetical protein